MNIIALGEENPSLRQLAAHQKAIGRRVFYQYMEDAVIRSIIQGHRDAACLHPPSDKDLAGCSELLADTVIQLQQLDTPAFVSEESDLFLEQALAELDEDQALQAALQGRIDLAKRDYAALVRRFDRWFPAPIQDTSAVVHYPGAATQQRLDEIHSLLLAVAEVSGLMSASREELAADALEIFQRSLYDAGVSPFEYTRLLTQFPQHFGQALQLVREQAGLKPRESVA